MDTQRLPVARQLQRGASSYSATGIFFGLAVGLPLVGLVVELLAGLPRGGLAVRLNLGGLVVALPGCAALDILLDVVGCRCSRTRVCVTGRVAPHPIPPTCAPTSGTNAPNTCQLSPYASSTASARWPTPRAQAGRSLQLACGHHSTERIGREPEPRLASPCARRPQDPCVRPHARAQNVPNATQSNGGHYAGKSWVTRATQPWKTSPPRRS
jgi:hypothetical protein